MAPGGPQGMRLRLTVEYDGTDFLGFQRQATGRTVQALLEAALTTVTPACHVVPAGRTDAGVHATGQVVHCDYAGRAPVLRLADILNHRLPADIAALDCREAPPDFHARYSALSRTYEYRIMYGSQRRPLLERYAWRVEGPLQQTDMAAVVALLPGSHSFRHFGDIPGRGDQRVRSVARRGWRRTIYRAELQREPEGLRLIIEADAFLTHMMRALTGAIIAVGRGRLDTGAVAAALADESSNAALAPVAPPHGLCLVRVRYPAFTHPS